MVSRQHGSPSVWSYGLTLLRNRGDLSEGWYDPATKQRADTAATTATPQTSKKPQLPPSRGDELVSREPEEKTDIHAGSDNEYDDDEYGPAMPMQQLSNGRIGPKIPSMQDIQYRNGTFILVACMTSILTVRYRTSTGRQGGTAR